MVNKMEIPREILVAKIKTILANATYNDSDKATAIFDLYADHEMSEKDFTDCRMILEEIKAKSL